MDPFYLSSFLGELISEVTSDSAARHGRASRPLQARRWPRATLRLPYTKAWPRWTSAPTARARRGSEKPVLRFRCPFGTVVFPNAATRA